MGRFEEGRRAVSHVSQSGDAEATTIRGGTSGLRPGFPHREVDFWFNELFKRRKGKAMRFI